MPATTRPSGPSRDTNDGYNTYDTQDDVAEAVAHSGGAKLKAVRFDTAPGTALRYLMIFDAAHTGDVSDGAVPVVKLPITGGETIEWKPPSGPMDFANGIYVCSSTSRKTRVITLAADMWIAVDWS